jgi:hypothetical protein
MSEITGLSSALQAIQSSVQTNIGTAIIKQAAQEDQAVADMLAKNASAAAEASQNPTASSGISIYA